MADYTIFKVGSTDYSAQLDTRTYSARKTDVRETWEDANHVTHSTVVRQKVVGELRLTFLTAAAYNSFVSVLAGSKNADGTFNFQVRVGSNDTTGALESIRALAEMTPRVVFATAAFERSPAVIEVTIEFEEA